MYIFKLYVCVYTPLCMCIYSVCAYIQLKWASMGEIKSYNFSKSVLKLNQVECSLKLRACESKAVFPVALQIPEN